MIHYPRVFGRCPWLSLTLTADLHDWSNHVVNLWTVMHRMKQARELLCETADWNAVHDGWDHSEVPPNSPLTTKDNDDRLWFIM